MQRSIETFCSHCVILTISLKIQAIRTPDSCTIDGERVNATTGERTVGDSLLELWSYEDAVLSRICEVYKDLPACTDGALEIF